VGGGAVDRGLPRADAATAAELTIEDLGVPLARSGAEVADVIALGAASIAVGTTLARAAKRRTEGDDS
jgi:hypothetical protein